MHNTEQEIHVQSFLDHCDLEDLNFDKLVYEEEGITEICWTKQITSEMSLQVSTSIIGDIRLSTCIELELGDSYEVIPVQTFYDLINIHYTMSDTEQLILDVSSRHGDIKSLLSTYGKLQEYHRTDDMICIKIEEFGKDFTKANALISLCRALFREYSKVDTIFFDFSGTCNIIIRK